MKTKMCAPNDVVRKVRGVSETGTAILRMCLVKNEMEEKKKNGYPWIPIFVS